MKNMSDKVTSLKFWYFTLHVWWKQH